MTTSNCTFCKYGGSWTGKGEGHCYMFKEEPRGVCAQHTGNKAQPESEPVADDIVAGALYDFLGYLTSRRTRITMSDRDDAGAAVDALVDWSKTRKINLVEARVEDWNTHTKAAPVADYVPLSDARMWGIAADHFNDEADYVMIIGYARAVERAVRGVR